MVLNATFNNILVIFCSAVPYINERVEHLPVKTSLQRPPFDNKRITELNEINE
jgi:hypothetical protein